MYFSSCINEWTNLLHICYNFKKKIELNLLSKTIKLVEIEHRIFYKLYAIANHLHRFVAYHIIKPN